MKQGEIERDGCRLGYQIEGVGEDVLFVGSSKWYPRLVSEYLRSELRLIFADMRAFAPPPESGGALKITVDTLVEDLEALRNHLGLKRVIVMGHSGHAFIALEYAKKYPERVSHVVLIGPSYNFSEKSLRLIDAHFEKNASLERKLALKKEFEACPDERIAGLEPDERFFQNYLRHTPRLWYDYTKDYAFLIEGVHVNGEIFDHIWNTLYKEIDPSIALEKVTAPIWIGLGRQDYVVTPPETWESLRPRCSNLTLQVFEKCGHSPFFEVPDQFDHHLLQWLK
ncbi:MAG: putative aminoacrylate hydrolase RutD [Chlamydiia bacterium]|nr:putative aminoacrylate hydrolase RutD [Chlamydiia bacterium]